MSATGHTLPPLVDLNCYLGEWPFRRYPCTIVDRLLARMDKLRIERAAVSRLENVFLKDCLVGNRELAALIAPHTDRFVPFYTVNPAFPGWEDDLRLCQEELGLAPGAGGIQLHPNYHAYDLAGSAAAALLDRAQDAGLPVRVATALEDPRTQHWLVQVPPIGNATLASAIAAFPALRWIIAGMSTTTIRSLWRDVATYKPLEVAFDLSLVQGPLDECAQLVESVGAGRLVFGTNLPLTIAESPLLALQYADLPDAVKAPLCRDNARRFLA